MRRKFLTGLLMLIWILGTQPAPVQAESSWRADSFPLEVAWSSTWQRSTADSQDESARLRLVTDASPGSYVELYAWESDTSAPADIIQEFLTTFRVTLPTYETVLKWTTGPNGGFQPEVIQFETVDGAVRQEALYPKAFSESGKVMLALVGIDQSIYIGTVLTLAHDISITGDWGTTVFDAGFGAASQPQRAPSSASTAVPTAIATANPASCNDYAAWRANVDRWLRIVESQSLPALDALLNEFLKIPVPPVASSAHAMLVAAVSAYDLGNTPTGDARLNAFLKELQALDASCG